MDINFNPFFNPLFFAYFSQAYVVSEAPKLEPIETKPQKSIKRTWNKSQIKELYTLTQEYCENNGKLLESLEIEDFSVIAESLNQTPTNCMKKMKEISVTGSLAPGAWSNSEDELLKKLANKFEKWGYVADFLNKNIHMGIRIRSGKQCKERWLNHLDPCMRRDKWEKSEDLIVLKLYKDLGNKWCEISKIIGNRTDSAIKNRVKSIINKQKQELKYIEENDALLERIIEKMESTEN